MSKASALTLPDPDSNRKRRGTKSHQQSRRVQEYAAKLQELLDTSNLALELYRDRKLTRTQIEHKILGFGYYVALRQLGAMACNPDAPQSDTKALDLFIRECKTFLAANEERVPSQDEPAPFKTRGQKVKSATPQTEPAPPHIDDGSST